MAKGETKAAAADPGTALPGVPYPTAFPAAEAMDLVSFLRGTGVTRERAVHCVWQLAGYALGQFLPSGGPFLKAEPLDDATLAGHLEGCCKEGKKGADKAAVAALPWNVILPALIQLLLRLLVPTP